MNKQNALILAALIVCHVQAAAVERAPKPKRPPANLVTNPDIQQGKGDKPLGWRFNTAMPDNFTVGWRDNGRSGKCLWLEAKSGKMSGYWSQTVRVAPGKTYVFSAHYRLEGGRILCYAHARQKRADGRMAVLNERSYAGSLRGHWLVPVFLPPDCLAGPKPDKWYTFRLRFKVPEQVQFVTLSLGMYFTPGTVSFDDVWFGLAGADVHPPSTQNEKP